MGQNFPLDLVADRVLPRATRTIIAGSRWIPQSYVLKVVDQLPPDRQPTTILSGGGGSVDRAGEVWAYDHRPQLEDAEPAVPAAMNDRAADNWRPLLAIADAIGPLLRRLEGTGRAGLSG